jgi:hypothetical protein
MIGRACWNCEVNTGQAEIHKMILRRQTGKVADPEALKMKVLTRDEVHQNMENVI